MTETVKEAKAAGRSARVDIVTVNWNSGPQVAEAVSSVRRFDPNIVASFVVVDNDSRDGSADFAADWDKLTIDKTGANLGFGRACNRGAARGTAPYILFLNPDTRMIESAITKAVLALEARAGEGYAICGIKLVDEHDSVDRHCARFPTLLTFAAGLSGFTRFFGRWAADLHMADFDHLTSRPVDHVMGAFYLIERRLFERLGGFDEDYFVYFEDLDLSLRAAREGAKTLYLAEAAAFHKGAGTTAQVSAMARFYGAQGRLIYARKNFSPLQSVAHSALTFTVEPALAIGWNLLKYRGRGLGGIIQAYRMLASDQIRSRSGSARQN